MVCQIEGGTKAEGVWE